MKTRVAVVGLGKMGLLHSSIMSTLEGVELVAVCEKSPLIRRFSGKMLPGIEVVDDLDKFSGMSLDAICVTTPPNSHFPIIKQVYTQKIAKHVFTEKPLATTHAEAKELCRLAEKQSSVNMVGYHRRFSVTFNKAKQILDEGTLGELISFEGYALSADFVGAKSTTQAMARGGVLKDSGCHVVDLALWLFGDMEVKSAALKSIIGEGSEDEAYFEVNTKKGLEGEFSASWCKDGYRLPEMGLTIIGTKGTIRVNEDTVELKSEGKDSVLWYKHDLDDTVPFFIGGSEYQRQDQLFINAIQQVYNPEPSFRTASKVEEIVDQVNDYGRGLRA